MLEVAAVASDLLHRFDRIEAGRGSLDRIMILDYKIEEKKKKRRKGEM